MKTRGYAIQYFFIVFPYSYFSTIFQLLLLVCARPSGLTFSCCVFASQIYHEVSFQDAMCFGSRCFVLRWGWLGHERCPRQFIFESCPGCCCLLGIKCTQCTQSSSSGDEGGICRNKRRETVVPYHDFGCLRVEGAEEQFKTEDEHQ